MLFDEKGLFFFFFTSPERLPFVNGKKIRYSQILQPGDRLTLAKDKPDENIANFIFDVKYTHQNLEVQEQDFFNHDILILVINSPEKLTNQEELFINNLKIKHFSKLFVIVDLPKEEKNLIKPNWANLYSDYELFTLFLFPYYNSNYNLQLEEYQKEQETLFLKNLSNLSLNNPNFVETQVQKKTKLIIEQIDNMLNSLEEELETKINKSEAASKEIGLVNHKESTQQAFNKFSELKDNFFKQTKQEIVQSKSSLLDPFIQKSLSYRIQYFIDKLSSKIITKNGFHYLTLQSQSNEFKN